MRIIAAKMPVLDVATRARRFVGKSLIDPYALNPQRNRDAWIALQTIIRFRNFQTGAGMYRANYQTGPGYKLCVGERNSFILMMRIFGRMVDREETSEKGRQEFAKIFSTLTELDEKIAGHITPAIKKICAEVARGYPEGVFMYGHPSNQAYKAEVYTKIGHYEKETLAILRMIDEQIDVLLGLFGLTRHSRISFNDTEAGTKPGAGSLRRPDVPVARRLRYFFGRR